MVLSTRYVPPPPTHAGGNALWYETLYLLLMITIPKTTPWSLKVPKSFIAYRHPCHRGICTQVDVDITLALFRTWSYWKTTLLLPWDLILSVVKYRTVVKNPMILYNPHKALGHFLAHMNGTYPIRVYPSGLRAIKGLGSEEETNSTIIQSQSFLCPASNNSTGWFSTVDSMAGSLAHMVCSKEARQSLTQVRGDQELPYQVAAIEAEDSEIPGWQGIYC